MLDISKLKVGDEVGYTNYTNYGTHYGDVISTVASIWKNGTISLADGTRFNRSGYSQASKIRLAAADDVRKEIAERERHEKLQKYYGVFERLLYEVRRNGHLFTTETKAALIKLANAIEIE